MALAVGDTPRDSTTDDPSADWKQSLRKLDAATDHTLNREQLMSLVHLSSGSTDIAEMCKILKDAHFKEAPKDILAKELDEMLSGRGRPRAVAAATPRTSTSRTSTCDTRPSWNSTSTSSTRAASLSPSESASQGKRRKIPAQFPCCGSKSTYKPENHFQTGTCLDKLFHRIDLGESDLLGCGYCPCEGSLYEDQGEAFVGRLGIIDHILKAHCQPTKNPPIWKYNNVLRNVISREPHFQKRLFKLLESKGYSKLWIPFPEDAPSEDCIAPWHFVQGLQSLAGITRGKTELDDNTKGRITKKLGKSFIITSLPTEDAKGNPKQLNSLEVNGLPYNPEEPFRDMGGTFPIHFL